MLTSSKTRYGNLIHFINDDPIGACLQYYGEWAQQEMDFLSHILKEDSVVFDVGANIGTHSVFFSTICPKGNVLAFEPQAYIYNLLVTNLTINGRFNAVPIKAAVSDQNDKIYMMNPNPFVENSKINYGEFRVNNEAGKGLPTDVVKLDNFIDMVGKLDLIKIDVEGMEVKVLDGACELIKKHKPALYLEFSEKNGNPELIDKLEEMNYVSFLHVYQKHNPNNFNKMTKNVWEEDHFIISKETIHKRFDASIICFHEDKVKEFIHLLDMPRASRKTSIFEHLFEQGLI